MSRSRGHIVTPYVEAGIICFLMILSACGIFIPHVSKPTNIVKLPERTNLVTFIIDDNVIKKDKNYQILMDNLKEALSTSIENVCVESNESRAQPGEIILKPDIPVIKLEKGSLAGSSEFEVEVITTTERAKYTARGKGKYVPSILEISVGEALLESTKGLYQGGGQMSFYYAVALKQAFSSMAADLNNQVLQSPLFQTTFREAQMAGNLPPDLSLSVRYSDNVALLPNGILDAGEQSAIEVSITNAGKGTAFDVGVRVETDSRAVHAEDLVKVGDIKPGATRVAMVQVSAGLDLEDSKISFLFHAEEKRGYDSPKLKVIVPAARFEKPDLQLTEFRFRDGNSGLSKGNANGIPENGETIELTLFVANQGKGDALGVELMPVEVTQGIAWGQPKVDIGSLRPGEISKAKMTFSIPVKFDVNEIAARFRVSDRRGVSSAEKRVTIPFAKICPTLRYKWRLLQSGNAAALLTNGENFTLEFEVGNEGGLPARDVVLSLSTAMGVELDRRRFELGAIEANSWLPPQRVQLSISRTFSDTKIPMSVEISQANFDPLKDVVRFDVLLRRPSLSFTSRLMSKAGGNILEQGESSALEMRILNAGSLPAEGVHVSLESEDENLSVLNPKDHFLGKIPANGRSSLFKVRLSCKRRIKVSSPSLSVRIIQDEFPPIVQKYALNIVKEVVDMTDLSDDVSMYHTHEAKAGATRAPSIVLISPRQGETTEEDYVYIEADVTDEKGVKQLRLEINGSHIDLSRGQLERVRKISERIPLKEGTNTIVVYADNPNGYAAREKIIIVKKEEGNIDIPPISTIARPNAVAVIIGISKYKITDIPPVDYGRSDGEAVKKYLVRSFGLKDSNVIELYDGEATLSNMKMVFEERLSNMLAMDGTSDVFVYYSGHGVPDTKSKDPYFVPFDANPSYIKSTGYSLLTFYDQLSLLNARTITVVIDACFSGGSEKGTLLKGISPAFLEVKSPELKIRNASVFASSRGEQVSTWYPKKGHGLFTYYFLLGIKGKADADNDGRITVGEMEKYLSDQVPKKARLLGNREQTPYVFGEKQRILLELRK